MEKLLHGTTIEVMNGERFTLGGWDGERFTDCVHHSRGEIVCSRAGFNLKPVYAVRFGELEIVDYEIRKGAFKLTNQNYKKGLLL